MSEPDARSEGEDSQLQAFITEAYTRAADDLEAAFKRLVMEMPGVIMGLRNQATTAFTQSKSNPSAPQGRSQQSEPAGPLPGKGLRSPSRPRLRWSRTYRNRFR